MCLWKEGAVKGLFWIWLNWISGLIDWGLHFGMGIILGTIPCWFLVFCFHFSGCSRNVSGVCPYLWVQEKIMKYRQSAKKAWLCPAEFLGEPFGDSAFDLLRNLCDLFLVNSRNGCVPWLTVPRMSLLCLSSNSCQLLFVPQCCQLSRGKFLNSSVDRIFVFNFDEVKRTTKFNFF